MTTETTKLSALALANVATSLTLGDGEYIVARQVTRTVLRQDDGKPFYVLIESAADISDMPEEAKAKKKDDMAPARVCNVVNLETGEPQVLIMNTVLESELDRAYPNGDYVGRSYAISRQQAATDKRYKTYRILEITKSARPSTVAVVATELTGEAVISKAKEKHTAAKGQ